jgi:transposase-like protein
VETRSISISRQHGTPKAAKRFLGKALNGLKAWEKPEVINTNTDKAPTYGIAISELKAEGKCPEKTVHRQVKYLNNVIEADHGKLKQLIRPVRGFKTLKTASATIAGFEVMRALRKGQAAIFNLRATSEAVKGGVKVDQCGGAKGSHYGSEKYGGIAGARTSGA